MSLLACWAKALDVKRTTVGGFLPRMSAFGTKRTRVISPLMSALTRSEQIGPLVGAQIEIKLMTCGGRFSPH